LESTQIRLVVPPEQDMVELLGQGDHLLRLIEEQFESAISVRGNEIIISGDPSEAQSEDGRAEALHRCHPEPHDHVRYRAGRDRQDLPGHGRGRGFAHAQGGREDHPDAAGGGGRREARLPARRSAGEDRPVSPAPL
jgi:hypothetical protein